MQTDNNEWSLPADEFDQLLRRAIHRQNLMTVDHDTPVVRRDIEQSMGQINAVRKVTCQTGQPIHTFNGEV